MFVPFLCLAVTMMIGALLGPASGTSTGHGLGLEKTDPTGERRRTLGAIAAGVLVLLIVWNFVYFWPLYTGTSIPDTSWRDRMWLDTWV